LIIIDVLIGIQVELMCLKDPFTGHPSLAKKTLLKCTCMLLFEKNHLERVRHRQPSEGIVKVLSAMSANFCYSVTASDLVRNMHAANPCKTTHDTQDHSH